MKIGIASDHRGYKLKEFLKKEFEKEFDQDNHEENDKDNTKIIDREDR